MKLEIVNNESKYWEDVRTLRNDPRVKERFIQQHEITPEEHKKHMLNNWWKYIICLSDGNFAGYARVIMDDIAVCVIPNYQGMGVGTYLINELMERNPTAFAKVKMDNESSIRLFEKCGFKKKYYILEKE